MRIEQTVRVFSLALAVAASACGSVLQSPDAGPDSGTDAGNDGGRVACRQLGEAECRTRTDCAVGSCAGICGSDVTFAGCYDPTADAPPTCTGIFAADLLCPAPCSALTDEASCTARPDCRPNRCPNCDGTSTFFTCVSNSPAGALICPAIACPAACSLMTTQESCDGRPDCHSVFVDPGTCGCASVGCCAHFSSCASGKAVCTPPAEVTCKIAKPFCEGPAYVLSYTTNCYEGCVPASACGVN